jgi:hypothetical protein
MKKEKIGRHNYEEFLIDYLDGNLDALVTAELLLFLEQHPDIKEEAGGAGVPLSFNSVQETYPFKELLKSSFDASAANICGENHSTYFIAYYEGDLDAAGKKAVENYISSNPGHKEAFRLFGLSRLSASRAAGFPGKKALKKQIPTARITFIWRAAVAASVLILASVFWRLEPINEDAITRMAGGIETPLAVEAEKPQLPDETAVLPVQDKRVAHTEQAEAVKALTFSTATQHSIRLTGEISPKQPLKSGILSYNTTKNSPVVRNDFSPMYNDIRLAQQLLTAQEEIPDVYTDRREFSLGRRLPGILRGGTQVITQVPGSVNGWMLADLGIQGYNLLTDNDVKLEREVDATGKTGNIRLLDGEIAYSLKRNQ